MKTILEHLFQHNALTRQQAHDLLLGIADKQYAEAQVAALLAAYRMRDIHVDELLGFRDALIERALPIDLSEFHALDIVGTGGDGKNTFNISTCACFVVAGAGYKVAKHGNYGASSVSGASTVLEQHGVRFTNNVDTIKRSIDLCGMAYLHAPLFHPALAAVGPLRRELKVKTLFNLLGPLVNPSHTAYQLLGVANLQQMRLYTNTLQQIGVGFTLVTSLDGYDEISLTDNFKVMSNHTESIYHPTQLGLNIAPQQSLNGGATATEAAHIFSNVLNGCTTPSQRDAILINAAFGIHTICADKSIETCLEEAHASLLSGRALKVFERFVELNHQ